MLNNIEMILNDSLVLTADNLDEIPLVAKNVIEFGKEARIFCFYGSMGAGKTTLIKAICEYFNVLDNVASPTFSIINEYLRKDDSPIYHFDFYRIKDLSEVYDIGYEDYFYSGNYCFIEWPELIDSVLPEKYVKVEIQEVGKGVRNIVLSKVEK